MTKAPNNPNSLMNEKGELPRTLWLLSGFLAFCLSLLVVGCNYSTESLLPSNVRTVYVPIFDNHTFRRKLEQHLTEAVVKEIKFKSDLKVVDKHEADSILRGEIVDFKEKVLTEDLADRVTESTVTIYVNITWIDRRTGRIIRKKDGIRDRAEFILTRGETESTATSESFEDLAEKIVNAMEEDF